jgi:hypothetical protein
MISTAIKVLLQQPRSGTYGERSVHGLHLGCDRWWKENKVPNVQLRRTSRVFVLVLMTPGTQKRGWRSCWPSLVAESIKAVLWAIIDGRNMH